VDLLAIAIPPHKSDIKDILSYPGKRNKKGHHDFTFFSSYPLRTRKKNIECFFTRQTLFVGAGTGQIWYNFLSVGKKI